MAWHGMASQTKARQQLAAMFIVPQSRLLVAFPFSPLVLRRLVDSLLRCVRLDQRSLEWGAARLAQGTNAATLLVFRTIPPHFHRKFK